MAKSYQLTDLEALNDSEKIVQFVKASINGENKPYWDSTPVPKTH